MSCFGGRVSPDLYQNCCNSNVLCHFDGDISSLSTEPIYVQKVFDAVAFHLQGMKSVSGQVFSPCIPCGHRIKRVIERDGATPEEVEARMKKQLSDSEMIEKADYVIENSGDICLLRSQVEKIYKIFV